MLNLSTESVIKTGLVFDMSPLHSRQTSYRKPREPWNRRRTHLAPLLTQVGTDVPQVA